MKNDASNLIYLCQNFEREKKTRLKTIGNSAIAAFHSIMANGGAEAVFTAFPSLKLKIKDPDLNRVHKIVNELDSRRMMYNGENDEDAGQVLRSIHELRKELRTHMGGVWATPKAERICQLLRQTVDKYCTRIEGLVDINTGMKGDWTKFVDTLFEFRIEAWYWVACLKKMLGRDIINPLNLPPDLESFMYVFMD